MLEYVQCVMDEALYLQCSDLRHVLAAEVQDESSAVLVLVKVLSFILIQVVRIIITMDMDQHMVQEVAPHTIQAVAVLLRIANPRHLPRPRPRPRPQSVCA